MLYSKPYQEKPPPTGEPPCTAVVAVAASAGGLKALKILLETLPADIPAAVLIVQHLDPKHSSLIAQILERHTTLDVRQAEHGDHLQNGWTYIAPPDYHLLVESTTCLALSQTPPVHYVRPSADLLFESAAANFSRRALAVVLTGTGADGSFGIHNIKEAGGVVIAQSEATAEFFGMPSAAIRTGLVDHITALEDISPLLQTLLARLDESA